MDRLGWRGGRAFIGLSFVRWFVPFGILLNLRLAFSVSVMLHGGVATRSTPVPICFSI